MVEKFSDYEGTKFLDQEGEFEFEVMSYELKDSSKGTPMAVFEVKSDAGTTTIYHSLNPKARWSYNNLIACCLRLDDKKKKTFELDYETIGQQLVGKTFIGYVECQSYTKITKVANDDGTFEDKEEVRDSYKIVEYHPYN